MRKMFQKLVDDKPQLNPDDQPDPSEIAGSQPPIAALTGQLANHIKRASEKRKLMELENLEQSSIPSSFQL